MICYLKNGILVRDMLTLQILNPSSILAYSQARKSTLHYVLDGKEDCQQGSLNKRLEMLENHFSSIRDGLNEALIQPNRLLLYDLSNRYFCARKAEVSGYGNLKKMCFDRNLVSYGIVMNGDNLPLDIRVWKESNSDVCSLHETFADWQKNYRAQQAIWVTYRSM